MISADSQQSKINLLDLSPAGMEDFFLSIGEKSFRAKQMMKWIYHELQTDFEGMSNFSKSLRTQLDEIAEIAPPKITFDKTSVDGTRKFIINVSGNNAVEAIFIPESGRGTLCVSSQVGCSLACTFCSTGTQGFNRNLKTSEIIGQVWGAAKALGHTQKKRVVTNVVMMGMGEPLLNYDNVVAATNLMRDDLGFGMSNRRVTISTAGMVPQLKKLKNDSGISLAVSLHAPNDALRNTLVPLNKKYPISELLETCKSYIDGKPKQYVTIEYTLIDHINDELDHAHQLVELLTDYPCKINLIPFNPFPGSDFKRPSGNRLHAFQKVLTQAGFVATIRKTRGDDIDAACGQLVGIVEDRTRRQEKHKIKIQSGINL